MSDQNFNQSMKHFCGESLATGLFMEANYHGGNYSVPLNTDREPQLMFGNSLESIMLAKNYNQSTKQDKMGDNDVHNQYVDFIVRTALFHREIDNPTTMGSGLDTIKQSLDESSADVLRNKLSSFGEQVKLNKLLESKSWVTTDQEISLKDVGISQNSSMYAYANAAILLLLLSVEDGAVIPANALPKTIDELKIAKVLYPARTTSATPVGIRTRSLATHTFGGAVNILLGNCNTGGDLVNPLGNFCLVSYLDASKTQTSAAKNIEAILVRNRGNKDTVLDELNDVLVKSFMEHAMRVYQSIGGIVGFYDNYHKLGDVSSKSAYVKNALLNVDTSLENVLKSNIVDALYSRIRGLMNVQVNPNYTTITKNHYANQLFEDVFVNWPNLNPMAREFYRQHLRVFRKVGNTIGTASNQAGWEDIKDRVEDNSFVRNLDRASVRINIMKLQEGSADVLFAKTLPFLPIGGDKTITGLWYTDEYGAVKNIVAGLLSATALQDIYKCVYMGNSCNVGGHVMNLPKTFEKVKQNVKDFDVNDISVIKNLIKSRKAEIVSQPSRVMGTSFADLYVEDMVTRVIYARDDAGLYRIGPNKERIDYSYDNIRTDNCAGTKLKGDQTQCSKFVRDCLLSGDKNSLSNCLAQLSNESLFNVGVTEIAQVDPNIAIQILRTFGVRQVIRKHPTLGEYGEPQTFESWRETVLSTLNPNLRDTITKNVKLCDYLKGVISFVTMNPAILNKNMRNNSVKASLADQPIDDAYIKALGKTMWTNPLPSSNEGRMFETQMLVKGVASPQFAITSPAFLSNPFNNVTHAQGTLVAPFGMMNGGASAYEELISKKITKNGATSQLVESLIESVVNDAKVAGVNISEIDYARLKDGSQELSKMEKELHKYRAMLRALTDLVSLLSASGCATPSKEMREISLNDIKSRSDTLAYLYQNIGDVQNCIGSNMGQQNSKCSELANLYATLVGSVNGKGQVDRMVDM
jgi:hypothetical protein